MTTSPFSALRTGYAERREAKPLVALVDNFDQGASAHGEITESVMTLHGGLKDEEIQRIHGDSGVPFSPDVVVGVPAEQVMDALDTFTIGSAGSFYTMVSDNLRLVLDEQPSVRVISQSQSQSPARLVEPFFAPIEQQPEFRQRLAQGLNLDSAASSQQVISSLLSHTEGLLQEDTDLQEAKALYNTVAKQAYDHGVVNLVAGGNQGELARTLTQMGVETGPETFRSILLNDWVTVVGAANAEGKPASLNSPNSGAEVYALGEKVPVKIDGQVALANGTSVSTPLIASQAAATIKLHPEWTAAQVEHDILYGP